MTLQSKAISFSSFLASIQFLLSFLFDLKLKKSSHRNFPPNSAAMASLLRNNDTLASDSIDDFHQATRRTEEQILKDEERLGSLVASAKATTEEHYRIRTVAQEHIIRIDALEAEVSKVTHTLTLNRECHDQTDAAVCSARAPRQHVEKDAADTAASARQLRSSFVGRGSTLQAGIVKMIASSNPTALQTQIEAQNAKLHARHSQLGQSRALVAQLRAALREATANTPAAFPKQDSAVSAQGGLSDDSAKARGAELRSEIEHLKASLLQEMPLAAEAMQAHQKQRDFLRQSTKQLCSEAEQSDARFHEDRREHETMNDTAAAKFCTMCHRQVA